MKLKKAHLSEVDGARMQEMGVLTVLQHPLISGFLIFRSKLILAPPAWQLLTVSSCGDCLSSVQCHDFLSLQ